MLIEGQDECRSQKPKLNVRGTRKAMPTVCQANQLLYKLQPKPLKLKSSRMACHAECSKDVRGRRSDGNDAMDVREEEEEDRDDLEEDRLDIEDDFANLVVDNGVILVER